MASLTAVGTVSIDVDAQGQSRGGLVAVVTGDAGSPTFSFDVSGDGGTTWAAVPAFLLASGTATLVTGGTANGTYLFNTGGMPKARLNLTAIASGTLTVTFSPGDGDSCSYLGTGVTVTPSGTQTVAGAAADDAAASGNPVPIGARFETTPDAVDTGDVGYVAMSSRRALHVQVYDSTNNAPAAMGAQGDALSNGADGLYVIGRNNLFNGTSWDRHRGNNDITVLASAARTATLQSSDITNYNAKGLHLVINVTAASATPSVVFTIQGKDALSSAYYTILASAAITGTGTTVLRVFPGATAAANLAANDILPRTWRVDATHADADSITYSVGASVIL